MPLWNFSTQKPYMVRFLGFIPLWYFNWTLWIYACICVYICIHMYIVYMRFIPIHTCIHVCMNIHMYRVCFVDMLIWSPKSDLGQPPIPE